MSEPKSAYQADDQGAGGTPTPAYATDEFGHWSTLGELVDELIERADEIEGFEIPAGQVGTHSVFLHPTGKVQDWLAKFCNEYDLWHRPLRNDPSRRCLMPEQKPAYATSANRRPDKPGRVPSPCEKGCEGLHPGVEHDHDPPAYPPSANRRRRCKQCGDPESLHGAERCVAAACICSGFEPCPRSSLPASDPSQGVDDA